MRDKPISKALIMAAGYGTRLEPLTLAVPKPMVPIVNKPTMRLNIELLRKYGIRDITANIHYHPEQIVNYFCDGSDFGVNLHYSYEKELMGTAGGVLRMARVARRINEPFLVLSSDAMTDINLKKMIASHKKSGALATIALSPVDDVEHFGVVETDVQGNVLSFLEKPKEKAHRGKPVNTGIYIFEPEILDMIPPDTFYDFGKELFPDMLKKGMRIHGYEMVEYWSDVGNLKAYVAANYDAMQGRVRLNMPGKKSSSCVWLGRDCRIDRSVEFEGCVVIGDRTEIRDGACIKDSVVGEMCVVGSEAKIDGSVVWSDTYISRRASVSRSVVGNWCLVGEGADISADCVISNRCKIGKGARVPASTLLNPNDIL